MMCVTLVRLDPMENNGQVFDASGQLFSDIYHLVPMEKIPLEVDSLG
jgi:hypothetical protein